MEGQAVGMIEVKGFVAAITAADTMVKAANVVLLGYNKAGSGLISVYVRGEVGAVKAATDAAASVVSKVGELVAVHVIARPHPDLENLLIVSE